MRGTGESGTEAVPAPLRVRTCAASAAGVEWRKTSAMENGTAKCSRTRAASRAASRECPPRSRKPASAAGGSAIPSTSA